MAENTHHDGDMTDHTKTYEGFLTLTKWTTIGVVIVLILMAIFLL